MSFAICRVSASRGWKIGGLLLGLLLALGAPARAEMPTMCGGTPQAPMALAPQGKMVNGAPQPDLIVVGSCIVNKAADYYYGNVNIVAMFDAKTGKIISSGVLDFEQPTAMGSNPDIDFWASSIVVEANGALMAGTALMAGKTTPYGKPRLLDKQGGFLTIHLYGPNQSVTSGTPVDPATKQGQGALCKTVGAGLAPCGIPTMVWNDNGTSSLPGCGTAPTDMTSKCIPGLPTTAGDRFYDYAPLYGDGKCTNGSNFTTSGGKALCGAAPADGQVGYFGYKVLAVSYGGSLIMNGYKGSADGLDDMHLASGYSWMRLKGDISKGDKTLIVDGTPSEQWWLSSDSDPMRPHPVQIVVTTTDYLPGHSEVLTIDNVQGGQVNLKSDSAVKWFHSGTRFSLADKLKAYSDAKRMSIDPDLVKAGAERRAAVALLTRSIRIVSGGDIAGQTFDDAVAAAQKAGKTYYFGGHTIFRQGLRQIQIQGVEFAELGQGGKLGHYPVHFHKTRQVPPLTFVKDSSVNDSNTHWYVIHSTQGVTLQRNVGWKSIGQGYYLEDGNETDNEFFSDIGIFAGAGINNARQNPRLIPGILSENTPQDFPYNVDYQHPSVFWITNGWNDFQGDMAAGAATCGACYWFVPASNSDTPDIPTAANTDMTDSGGHMLWKDAQGRLTYAGLQRDKSHQGATPLRTFYGNYCSSAMHSFMTTSDASNCMSLGVLAANIPAGPNQVSAVKSFAPDHGMVPTYYPNAVGGTRQAVRCPEGSGAPDCTGIGACGAGNPQCAVTVLDHYTSSFHWAQHNFAAIWMRPQWSLVDNSVLTDVQNAGLTMITGGDYTVSSVIPGYWGLTRNTIFAGYTQPQDAAHAFAADDGPFNADSQELDPNAKCAAPGGGYCLNQGEGVSLPLTNFATNQRLYSIYDGPSYEDSNAFLDIRATPCTQANGCIYAFGTPGVRQYTSGDMKGQCYLPNAAIAWKQPNGFYYPPAFHSTNLFFNNVAIRHYVLEPLFQAPAGVFNTMFDFGQGGTYLTNLTQAEAQYCSGVAGNTKFFDGFTGIDRQTELNDDDGSLTGLINTVSADQPERLKQTISINEDQFFDAKVKTSECLSNVGITPDKACPVMGKLPITDTPSTALTSPYDYVTTVIIPNCATTSGPRFGRCGDDTTDVQETCENGYSQCCTNNPKPPPAKLNICIGRYLQQTGKGGTWSSDCTNQACYGVPLYRQFLAGTDTKVADTSTREWKRWYTANCGGANISTPQCRWPFMRMSGQNIYSRNTLTVNNGTYFLDTAVPLAMQNGDTTNKTAGEPFSDITPCQIKDQDNCSPRSNNVFKPGETYYIFFLYVKPSTAQTYKIYVGPGFNKDTVKGVRMDISTAPVKPKGSPVSNPAWLDTPTVDANNVLSVRVHFDTVSGLTPSADNLCEPKTFCKNESGKCVAALGPNDPLRVNPGMETEAGIICGTAAVKDLDCPADGCYGFSFTLKGGADGFVADDTIASPQKHRPQPVVFPGTAMTKSQPDWTTMFDQTTKAPDNAPGGACYYPSLPGSQSCPIVQ